MKILLVGKNISNVESMDYINIVLPLIELEHSVYLFDILNEIDKNSNEIKNLIQFFNVDLIFFIPVENEIDIKFVFSLTKKYKTLVYFYDDSWRTEYSANWANAVNFVVTSNINWKFNFKNSRACIIYAPFFINIKKYKILPDSEKKFEVSFVGQYHPSRAWVINKIKNSGIPIKVFGKGWAKDSELTHEEMIKVFNESKINLNLSNCINFDLRHLLDFKNNSLIDLMKSYKLILGSKYKKDQKVFEMVKSRFYEINACGGFQISFFAQGLEREYIIGEELDIFENTEQLVNKIKYYLENEKQRESIANKGYLKTIQIHDSKFRLSKIFSKINPTISF